MEYVIAFGVFALIMLCLGFDLADIGMLMMWLIGAVVILTGLFFAAMLVFTAVSKPVKGEFVRFDENRRFPRAVYRVNGEEYGNVFPGEMMMKKKLYVEGRQKRMLKSLIFGLVIDGNAFVTIILGAAVFIPSAYGAAVFFIDFLAANNVI